MLLEVPFICSSNMCGNEIQPSLPPVGARVTLVSTGGKAALTGFRLTGRSEQWLAFRNG